MSLMPRSFFTLTIGFLYVVSENGSLPRSTSNERYLQNLHDSIQQPMYHLKSTLLVTIKRGHPPIIPTLSLLRVVLDGDIRYFEKFQG